MRNKLVISIILFCSINIIAVEVIAEELSTSHSTLSDLVRKALDANPGVQSAQAALDAARFREQAGNQPLYNPELEADLEDAVDLTTSVGINQTIDWSNKRGARASIGSFNREAAAAELHRVRQNLAVELLNAVIQKDVARQLYKISIEREKLMREFAALARQRNETGDLNQVELDLAYLALSEAQIQLYQAESGQTQANQSLAAVLGDGTYTIPALPDIPPDSDIQSPNIEQLLNELPAMRVQIARIAAAASTLKLRSLETRPDPTIGVRAGQEDTAFLTGINVSIPLFVRNNFRAEVDTANAELIQIELVTQDLYRRLHAQLSTSLDRFRLAHRAWGNWVKTGKESLGSRINVLNRLWRAGEISTTDYLVQINQTIDTRAAATDLHGRVWQAWLDWLSASGKVDVWLDLSMAP